ncbi:ATP-grasp fold amidoligase family protein [Phycisphaerales bacterium AB-hyl4]|uniref:ATP-grasp fold amidoligase family protein n=1 Tax=Natronomicrosphaera hydrolytica TaxID=3242702 RepID=A0ABV4U1L9_9BACT
MFPVSNMATSAPNGSPTRRVRRAVSRWRRRIIPDRLAVPRQYHHRFGVWPNLHAPKTFNEKLQWLKLNYRRPDLHTMVDKYAVRAFVESRVGAHYLNDLLGIWDRAESIDLDVLPRRFVLKGTHGSGMNIICPDRQAIDWPDAVRKLNGWLKQDFYISTREWPYKKVPPRIIGEAFLDSGEDDLTDYKVYCFDGKPQIIQADMTRYSNHTRLLFDLDWQLLPFELQYPKPDHVLGKPDCLDEMFDVARVLSNGLPFCRVDLYSVQGRIVFGEMTMYPGNGMLEFRPPEWDRRLGDLLALPEPVNPAPFVRRPRASYE